MTNHQSDIGGGGVRRAISRRQFLGAATVAGAGTLLAACSSGSPQSNVSAGTARRGGDLIFARTADPGHPGSEPLRRQRGNLDGGLNLYDCLYAVTPNGHGSKPWLAVSHEISSDQLTWTFHLRPGVKFSDGKPLTAADVQFTIERAAKGLNGYIDASIESVDAPDTSTVRIHTHHPWGPLLGDLSLYANAILPKDLRGMTAAQFFDQPIGTGPFKLESWSKGQQLKVVRNPHYWQQGKPLLDSVTFVTVPDDNTRLLQLRGNQADIMEFPPFSAIANLEASPGIVVKLFPSTWVSYIGMNEKRPQFADVHVRRAISYAIDRQSIIKSVLFNHGQPAASFFSPGWAFYNPATPALWYDLAKAKSEMAMSSFPHGFPATMIVVAGDTVNGAIAQIVQANLAAIGIKLTIRSYDLSAWQSIQQSYKYDIYPDYYTLDIGDPDENTPWAIDPVRGGTDALYTSYRDPQVMAWSTQAEQTIDPKERAAIYAKLQDRVAMDAPFAELYDAPYAYAYRNAVGGFAVYPTGNYHLENVWLAS